MFRQVSAPGLQVSRHAIFPRERKQPTPHTALSTGMAQWLGHSWGLPVTLQDPPLMNVGRENG